MIAKNDAELVAALQDLPYKFFERLAAKKLKTAGVKNHKRAAAAFVAHTRSGNTNPFTWDDGTKGRPKNIAFNISDKELAEISRLTDDFMTNKFPQVLNTATDKCASGLVKDLKAKWREEAQWHDAQIAQFIFNLHRRWGKGLALLRMLLTIFREQGADNVKRLRRRKSVPAMQEVMYRLHARSCQVAEEIITLLESGLADGAMARWRTLHELSVTAILIAEHGEGIAKRYIEHQLVESKKAMEDYEKVMVPLGYKPMSKVEKLRVIKGYNAVMQKYKAPFRTQYGWASEHLKHPQPTFRDLEKAAKRANLRSHYQMAGYNVHAGAKGIFFQLGSLNDVVLAGRSNAGLTEPAQNTAHTLCLIHSLLRETKQFNVTQIVAMKAIVMIRDEIPPTFWRAEKKLMRDHRAFRRLGEADRTKHTTRKTGRKNATG